MSYVILRYAPHWDAGTHDPGGCLADRFPGMVMQAHPELSLSA
jgi:hypothetical protein